MNSKVEAIEEYTKYKTEVENQLDKQIKMIISMLRNKNFHQNTTTTVIQSLTIFAIIKEEYEVDLLVIDFFTHEKVTDER